MNFRDLPHREFKHLGMSPFIISGKAWVRAGMSLLFALSVNPRFWNIFAIQQRSQRTTGLQLTPLCSAADRGRVYVAQSPRRDFFDPRQV